MYISYTYVYTIYIYTHYIYYIYIYIASCSEGQDSRPGHRRDVGRRHGEPDGGGPA